MIKKAISTILIFTMATAMLPSATNPAEVQAASNGWNLVWSDEFDGNSLNRDNWNVEVNGFGGGNEELQYYLDRPENIDVSDGTLKIIARKEYYEEKDYTSARLNTLHKVDFGYGKIEAKMKLPKFKGAFPAFWMLGSNYDTVGYPACGEIDIVETINDQSIPYCTAHWPYGSSIKSSGSNLSDVGESIDTSEWHEYTMIRNEKEIVWYVDDILVHKVDLASSPEREALTKEMQILLNFAIGGLWPGFDIDDSALPASMEVDYIRFYERDSDYVPVYEKEDSVQLYDGTWENEVASWSAAEGKIISTDNPADGFTADITKIGNSEWGVQASLRNLDYRRGNTYTFSCTLLSDIDKYVFVKVQGDGTSTLAGEYVHLTANEPYNYETTVTLAYEYTGSVSLYFAMGGNANEETIDRHSPMYLKVSDVSFYTLIEKETEEVEASVTLDGFQISTYANGFRTIYSIESNTDDIVERGVVYGIGEVPSEDMIVGSSNGSVVSYKATEQGLYESATIGAVTSEKYVMTMKLIPNKEFYSSKLNVCAYAKRKDGTYVYSTLYSTSIYEIADTLYSNQMMNSISGHKYLYDEILHLVNPDYEEIGFDKKSIVLGEALNGAV